MTPFPSNPHLSNITTTIITSGSVQLSVIKTHRLKIILIFEIGFVVSLLLSSAMEQNAANTV
jgi:hypothetical protein